MPGKFQSEADEYAYALTLDGTNDTAGTVEFRGWAGLIYLDSTDKRHLESEGFGPSWFNFDADEPTMPVAAIVTEDSQGFVSVAWFDSEPAAEADWAEVSAELDGDDIIEELDETGYPEPECDLCGKLGHTFRSCPARDDAVAR